MRQKRQMRQMRQIGSQMKLELISHTADAADLCGRAAAICTGSDAPERSLRGAMTSGHESILEHAVFTFRVTGISRACLAQITRHRIASFSVQSQRYAGVDVSGPLVIPESIRTSEYAEEAERLMKDLMDLYKKMTDAGIPCEDAR